MAQFILYTYQFAPHINSKHNQMNLFGEVSLPSVQSAMENKLDTFSKKIIDTTFVHGSHNLNKQILYNDNNIIAFRLANKKKITTEKNFIKNDDINEPSIIVFINNNDRIQRIAIEEQKSIFSDTSVVVGIIQKSLKEALEKENLILSIKKEFRETEFWDTVKEYNDAITMLRFSFEYPNLPRSRTPLAEMIKSVTQEINGASSTAQFNAPNDGILQIDETDEQLDGLAKEAANTGNLIKFKVTGERRIRNIGKSNKSCTIELSGKTDANELSMLMDKLKEFTDSDV